MGGSREREREWDRLSVQEQQLSVGAIESSTDLDVTVLAFAQWVSEMKARQHNSQHQMQAEMSMIRNAISSNHTDLSDFKRHGAAIQQQMQSEINEIRESLSNVFMEITAAVRNNAAADQDIKLKIQSLSEQAVRNETAFAQLADAADQSQSKLRHAVTEMQLNSERMREDLGTLNRHTDNLETVVGDRAEKISVDMDQFTQDLHIQLERRKEHLKKMVNDVVRIGEDLHNLVADFGEHRKGTTDTQSKLQSSLYVLDHTAKKDNGPIRALQTLQTTSQVLQPGNQGYPTNAVPAQVSQMPQVPSRPAGMPSQVRLEPVARPMGQVVMPGQGQPMLGNQPMGSQPMLYR